MRQLVGAILVLAGSVLISGGLIADSVSQGNGGQGNPGYILGALFALPGVLLILTWVWDAIPVDSKRPRQVRAADGMKESAVP